MPPLSESQLKRINRVLAARYLIRELATRRQMRPIPVDPRSSMQRPAMGLQVFELQKDGANNYKFVYRNGETLTPPPPHGVYVFVVLPEEPGRIYCGGPLLPAPFQIDGHTSLTDRKDVLYAGELRLFNRRLLSWNHNSGHYRPNGELRHVNLIPAVRLLLPGHLFDPCST
ncbi:hypothetical protein KNO81_39390 [Paraburkholderia sediminicola]|jgi:hypothetical protein|nr:hypothetical protein [Paraburkholderia sediminicola]